MSVYVLLAYMDECRARKVKGDIKGLKRFKALEWKE